MIYIGIDTGTNTGFAVWDSGKRKIIELSTLTITKALYRVWKYAEQEEICLYIEDARLRKWYGNTGRERLQGAGSVKRDAKIWEDFCEENGLNYHMIAPGDNPAKMEAPMFRTVTGWKGKCSQHARDAMMLVYGR